MEQTQARTDAEISITRVAARGAESKRVRCRCLGCGAHVQAVAGVHLYGQCSNCGGIDLLPLDPPSPR